MAKKQKRKWTPEGIKASSATRRDSANKVGKVFKVEPDHSLTPTQTFAEVLELAADGQEKRALEWYARGIARGMSHATDRMLDGTLTMDSSGHVVSTKKKFAVKVNVKIGGKPRMSKTFSIASKDIGFNK